MQKVYLESCLCPFPMSSCPTPHNFFHSLFHGDPQKYLDPGDFLIFHHFSCPKQLVLMFPCVQQVLLVRVLCALSQASSPDPPFFIFHHLPVHVRVWRPQSIPRSFSGIKTTLWTMPRGTYILTLDPWLPARNHSLDQVVLMKSWSKVHHIHTDIHIHPAEHTSRIIGLKVAVKVGNPCL